MFKNGFKSLLAIATIAAGASFATAQANAGNLSFHIGNGYNSVHFHSGGKRFHRNGVVKHRHVHRPKGPHCGPRRALNRAHRLGVYRPHIARINHKKIVVKGWNRGHTAKVVFKRTKHGCKVIRARGL